MYEKLFTPQKIGSVEIPNRLVVTAMVSNFCNVDGTATERYIAYHEEKAKGGYGLIITEDYAINEHAMGYKYIAGLWNEDQIASHRELTDRVHQYDSKIFAQIYHAGRQTHSAVNGGVQPVAVSPIACPWTREMPLELTIEEIQQIVKDFGTTALRVKKAGFDGVEIHAGNGYLIAGFMSFYQNKRTDKYGGNFTNRMRLLKEVYEEVRGQVGPDFPVIVRFSADEHMVGGRDLAETRVIVKMLEKWGLDGINCSNGVYGTYNLGQVAPMYMPHAWTINNAEEVKKLVDIPVIGVNRINDPLMADTLLSMGMCDFIGMARGSLADPGLPNKAKAGDLDSIRYCIGCLQGCVGALYPGEAIQCLVNPELGNEYRYDFEHKVEAKNVLVIGGGVAGMEAAKAAVMRGHKVTLSEKDSQLGGQFRTAAYPPGKGEFTTYIIWLATELDKLGVEVQLNTEVSAELVKKLNPDKVILAAGGTPCIPPIPGIKRKTVVLAEDVLLGTATVQGRILICGGGEVGLETAVHLAYSERGKITIVEMMDQIAGEMDGVNKLHVMRMAKEREVDFKTNTKVIEFTEKGVVLEHNGVSELFYCDNAVLAMGYKPNKELVAQLDFLGDKLVVVGDAVKVSNALASSQNGFEAGYNA